MKHCVLDLSNKNNMFKKTVLITLCYVGITGRFCLKKNKLITLQEAKRPTY